MSRASGAGFIYVHRAALVESFSRSIRPHPGPGRIFLNGPMMDFYRLRRMVEDILEFVARILYEENDDEAADMGHGHTVRLLEETKLFLLLN